MKTAIWSVSLPLLFFALAAVADEAHVTMHKIDANGVGEAIGTIHLTDTSRGLAIKASLKGLPSGSHGLHVHESSNCGPKERDGKPVAGLAAGGHYDRDASGKHEGPTGKGHLGDLPVLEVAGDGAASQTITAPRLKVADIKGRSLMIHEGGDNYSDQPKPLGGGGGRIACGIINCASHLLFSLGRARSLTGFLKVL